MSSGVVAEAPEVRSLYVAAATASAATELAAFDRALVAVGAANHNLIRLSSVIPPGSAVSIVPRCPSLAGASWGDRLDVGYAEQRGGDPGAAGGGGGGWGQGEGP